jgi:aspartate-semialdehyde dehydrogenase
MNIAIVGATGMVGRTMLEVINQRNITFDRLFLVASERSKGTQISFQNKPYTLITIEEALEKPIDYALFSAGGTLSKIWAPKFAEKNITVIDNSSAWRMDENIPLVVPQINLKHIQDSHKIIANPNCSTIQLVMALAPLHQKYQIKRLVVSTYQSVTGTGKAAVDQMMAERQNAENFEPIYPHKIDLNCIPQCDVFLENGYTKEEMKVVNETRKILGDDSINITVTAVRVPVMGGHSEAVNITFENDYNLEDIATILSKSEGIVVLDNPQKNEYPMPLNAHNKDEVFVGRIRRDESAPNSLNMWIVADNLRKGAATNAVEIMQYLENNKK